ncbi:hypothetical protein [Streptomyces sp. NPDC002172]
MPASIFNGSISFGLVSIPITVLSARPKAGGGTARSAPTGPQPKHKGGTP